MGLRLSICTPHLTQATIAESEALQNLAVERVIGVPARRASLSIQASRRAAAGLSDSIMLLRRVGQAFQS
jgi:hypothetical protein